MNNLQDLQAVKDGQALLERRRAEYAFNHPHAPRPPAAINKVMANSSRVMNIPAPQPQKSIIRIPIFKIYPMLGLASISSHRTGAWRAWTIARDLDPQGCGQVGKRHLLNRLNELQVSHRQVRRWLTAAHRLGLWTEKQGRLYLVSLAKAAYKLGAPQVGQAAMIDQSALVSKNWRAFVWAGFIATLHDRPISQAKKWDLTGIDPRTQRNYQKQFESNHRGNYAQTDLKPKHIGGMMETEGGAYFVGHNHQVIRRLPDIVNVPDTVSKAAPKGRSRKAQKLLNSLFYEEQRNEQFFRLFCETPKQVTAVERQISRDDRFPWEKPRELYQLKYAGRANNLYTTISMGAVL